MRTELNNKFEAIIEEYLERLSEIDDNYFLNGKTISKSFDRKDNITIFLLINDYTCLVTTKYLLKLFRYVSIVTKSKVTIDPTIYKIYEEILYKLLLFKKRISDINTMDEELFLSNPSESNIVNLFIDLDNDLYDKIILDKSNTKIETYDNSYVINATVGLRSMIHSLRILLVNSAYTGRNNKFITLHKELLGWLESTVKELNEKVGG